MYIKYSTFWLNDINLTSVSFLIYFFHLISFQAIYKSAKAYHRHPITKYVGDSTENSNSWVHAVLSHFLPLHRLQIYFSFWQSHPQCYKKWYIRSDKTLEILSKQYKIFYLSNWIWCCFLNSYFWTQRCVKFDQSCGELSTMREVFGSTLNKTAI